MRILITGASGFIGRHLTAALAVAGHQIVCCVRDPVGARRMFPAQEVVPCDFTRDTDPEIWLPRVRGVGAVINCAGILHARRRGSMVAIHTSTPKALFTACLVADVPRVVQISALGVAPEVDTEYARTKLAADDYLQGLGLDWTILRPSLAYTGAGSYGGTSLFRALAALPWVLPVVGSGEQAFQPIHMADLAEAVRRVVEDGVGRRQVIDVVGPEPVGQTTLLAGLRGWLGEPPARLVLHLPLPLVRAAAWLGNWFGRGPLTTTALTMMMRGNTADPRPFMEATGITPRRFADALASEPAHVQDRWHARLYFLRPLLRLTLGAYWVYVGLITLALCPKQESLTLLRDAGVPGSLLTSAAFYAGCLLDVLLGGALLMRYRVRLVGAVMLAVTLAYLSFLTVAVPWRWFYPIAPLPIVIPLMLATLVIMAIEDDR